MTNLDPNQWIGRSETCRDLISANHLAAWHATLDRHDPFPLHGAAVDPGFHWTLFPPLTRQSELGEDGHPKKGGFLPPIDLPRRMWAGGRLYFHQPLHVGENVERHSVIERVDEKAGKSGRLVFLLVRHSLMGDAGLAIEEEQDIVYREAAQLGSVTNVSVSKAQTGPWCRKIVPDDVLLFRYSALTFNGHRIHYNRNYATSVEGYPGLVVHAPLIATLLLDLLRRQGLAEKLEKFSFKALRPTFDTTPFEVDGNLGDSDRHFRLWSTDNQGAKAMEAEAWLR